MVPPVGVLSETTDVKLLLELPSTTIQALERMDACIWEQCRNTFPAVKYMPMVHNQKVLASMVVDGSALLTQLHFCPLDGTCVMGTGSEFLVAQPASMPFSERSPKLSTL